MLAVLLSYLPACHKIGGSAYFFSNGSNPWDAVFKLSTGVSLCGHELPFRIFVNRRFAIEVEVNDDEFQVEAREMNLARDIDKNLT